MITFFLCLCVAYSEKHLHTWLGVGIQHGNICNLWVDAKNKRLVQVSSSPCSRLNRNLSQVAICIFISHFQLDFEKGLNDHQMFLQGVQESACKHQQGFWEREG